MSGGQDQAAEAINPVDDLDGVFVAWASKYLSPLRHQLASLQVEQACIRARLDSMGVREPKWRVVADSVAAQLDFGSPVQFRLNGCWKVGRPVVMAGEPHGHPVRINKDLIMVSCLDGLWLVAAGDVTDKPLRND